MAIKIQVLILGRSDHGTSKIKDYLFIEDVL